jgi:hypothetical protein
MAVIIGNTVRKPVEAVALGQENPQTNQQFGKVSAVNKSSERLALVHNNDSAAQNTPSSISPDSNASVFLALKSAGNPLADCVGSLKFSLKAA